MNYRELAHQGQTYSSCIGVQNLYKSMIFAFMATFALAVPAVAQTGMSPVGPQPTTFQIQVARLDALVAFPGS